MMRPRHHLARWAVAMQITFTRGRVHHSNGNAYVDQKNYTIVRPRSQLFPLRHCPRAQAAQPTVGSPNPADESVCAPTQTGVQDPYRRQSHQALWHRHHPGAVPAARPPRVLCDADRNNIVSALDNVNVARLRRTIGDLRNRLVHLAKQRGPVPNQPHHHIYGSGRKLDQLPPNKRASADASTTQPKRHIYMRLQCVLATTVLPSVNITPRPKTFADRKVIKHASR
jgi:hypothetical protein